MTKIAICTDNHFGVRGDSEIFRDHIETFFDRVFFPYIDKHDITHIIQMGDIMDRRKYVNYKTAKSFRKHFVEPCLERNLVVDNILGNHDVALKSTNSINCLEELLMYRKGGENLTVYSSATEVNLYGLKVLFIPWINRENYEDTLHVIKQTDAKIAFGHLEITGFEMEKGHLCEEGLKKSLFDKFEKVYSGHFHHKSDDGKIFYLGTQYELFWSDFGQTKGFHVFDTETEEMEFIQNPYSKMFHKIVYNDNPEDGSKPVDWNQYDFSKLKHKAVKIIVEKREDVYSFERFIERVIEQEPFEYSLIEDIDYSLTQDEEEINVQDTLSLLYTCVDSIKDSSNDKGKSSLKMLFKELHEEAINIS